MRENKESNLRALGNIKMYRLYRLAKNLKIPIPQHISKRKLTELIRAQEFPDDN